MPRVSIIIAVLNGIRTIGKAIESAQAQTERDLEILVVDDGSTDGTPDFVHGYAARDPRIRLIRLEKNVGAAAATNVAIAQAKGDWIGVLDADDWYEPGRVEALLKAAAHHDADLVGDNLRIFDHIRGKIIEVTQHCPGGGDLMLDAETYFRRDHPLLRHPIGLTQPLMRRKFLADHNITYDPSHRVGYDFLIVAEALLCGAKGIIIPDAGYVYMHMFSLTTRQKSPTSHTRPSHAMMVRGCNELLAKYAGTMTPGARRALLFRRYVLETLMESNRVRDAFRERRRFEALRILLSRPFILVLAVAVYYGLIVANLKSLFGSSGKNAVSSH